MASSRKSLALPDSDALASDALAADFAQTLADLLASAYSARSSPVTPTMAVAFSGGLDSTALLHLASAYARSRGQRLHAFHIHHGLSPQADAWLAHSQQVAQALGLPFAARKVTLELGRGKGVEEAARLARYHALGALCRLHGVDLLLCAHHQDDQAETVLLQWLRGAGLPGLAGMAVYQPQHALLGLDVGLGRPLLHVRRQRLEQFCREHNLPWVEDESNGDPRFRRNALRLEVMPALDKHFPGFASLLARSAGHAQSAQALLQELAAMDLQACQDPSGALLLTPLQALSPARGDNLLRHWLARQGASLPSTTQLAQIRQQMLHAQADRHPRIRLGTQQLQRIAGRLVLSQWPASISRMPTEVTLQWAGESRIAVPAWEGVLGFQPVGSDELGLSRQRLQQQPLQLRLRSGGERLQLTADRPSRSLKNLFQEAGIPAGERLRLPLVYLGDDLVFAAGLGLDVRHGCRQPDALVLHWQAKP